ncbi:MAG: hypothetical protein AAF346_20630, partial [Pseudomonadota bacterium]
MFQKFSAFAAIPAACLAFTPPVHATDTHPDAQLNSMKFETQSAYNQVVRVQSTDKIKWNKIKSGSVQFWGFMKVDTKWPGYVEDVAVKLGNCGPTTCGSHPSLFDHAGVIERDYVHQRNFTVNTSQLPAPSNLIQTVPYAKQIIARCNEHLAHDGPTQEHSFDFEMEATFLVDTGKHYVSLTGLFPPLVQADSYDVNHGDRTKTAAFKVSVVCEPVLEPPTNDIAIDFGDFKINDVKLFLSTFSGATTQPNPATTCPKARVLVRLATSKPGLTHFKLWTKVGSGASQSKMIAAQAKADGNGGFKAEHTEWVTINKTTVVQAMAEETISTIGKYDGWKSISLNCKGAGGHGGFAPDTSTGNPNQPEAPPLNIKGEFSYIDHGSPKCSRTGKVLISIKTNRANDVHYNLDCTNGKKFSGIVKPIQSPAGGLVAVALKSFTIDTTTNYSCALKTTAPGVTKLHEWKAHKFQCVSRLVEPASEDVTHTPPAPAPQPENPTETNPEVPFKLEGELSYVDAQAPACRRNVKALATILS